jgi:hypothetical protein
MGLGGARQKENETPPVHCFKFPCIRSFEFAYRCQKYMYMLLQNFQPPASAMTLSGSTRLRIARSAGRCSPYIFSSGVPNTA